MVEHELEEGCELGEEEVDVLHMLLEVGMLLSEVVEEVVEVEVEEVINYRV